MQKIFAVDDLKQGNHKFSGPNYCQTLRSGHILIHILQTHVGVQSNCNDQALCIAICSECVLLDCVIDARCKPNQTRVREWMQ